MLLPPTLLGRNLGSCRDLDLVLVEYEDGIVAHYVRVNEIERVRVLTDGTSHGFALVDGAGDDLDAVLVAHLLAEIVGSCWPARSIRSSSSRRRRRRQRPQWWVYVVGDGQRVWAGINLPIASVANAARRLWPLALWLIRPFFVPDLPDPPTVA